MNYDYICTFNNANMPLVSIIMPAYNSARFISETVKSIQAQTFTDWELLITDDCSTDDTALTINELAASDSRIKLEVLDKNSGCAVARNHSLQRATGRYIAFCDSDDRWVPEKLEKQIAFMQEKKCGFSYTAYFKCDEDGKPYRIVECRKSIDLRRIRKSNEIPCLTAMYDTEIVGKVYSPELRIAQDWAQWYKVLEKCNVAYGMQEPLACYIVRRGSLSKKKKDNVTYNQKVLTDVMGMGKIKAWFWYWFVTMPRKI